MLKKLILKKTLFALAVTFSISVTTFAQTGNVGIGTTSPAGQIEVIKPGRTRTITNSVFARPFTQFFFGDNDQSLLADSAFNTLHVMAKTGANLALWGNGGGVLKFLDYRRSLTDENLASIANINGIAIDGPAGNSNGAMYFAVRSASDILNSQRVPRVRMVLTTTGLGLCDYTDPILPSDYPQARLHVIKNEEDLTPVIIEGCKSFLNDANAISAGLTSGMLYRVGTSLRIVP